MIDEGKRRVASLRLSTRTTCVVVTLCTLNHHHHAKNSRIVGPNRDTQKLAKFARARCRWSTPTADESPTGTHTRRCCRHRRVRESSSLRNRATTNANSRSPSPPQPPLAATHSLARSFRRRRSRGRRCDIGEAPLWPLVNGRCNMRARAARRRSPLLVVVARCR